MQDDRGAHALRRAGRQLSFRRRRFEPDGAVGGKDQPCRTTNHSTANSHNIRATTKATTRVVVAQRAGNTLHQIDITAEHFATISRRSSIISIFRSPGPGSFPQFMVSELAAKHVKVVLGGQGGDEIFGGYARYLIAYFEQCIKAAIDGNYRNGNYVVTIEVDRAQSRTAARIQAAAARVLARGAVWRP